MNSAENVDKDILDCIHGSLLELIRGDAVEASAEWRRRIFFLQNSFMAITWRRYLGVLLQAHY